MRKRRLLLLLLAVPALVFGGCAKRGPQYAQYQYAPAPQAAQAGASSMAADVPYRAPVAAPAYQPPLAQSYPAVIAAPNPPAGRGLFNIGGPVARAPAPAPAPAAGCGPPGCMPGAPAYSYAAYPQPELPYLLDAGDRLRITVFGQDGLTNSYAVDAAGNVTLPLVGTLPARGLTTAQLAYTLTERLKQGYIREPKVAIEVEAYRPFFIHGEVANPGQYAYVPNMTVENAIAVAGGFGPRADRGTVTLSRTVGGRTTRAAVGLTFPLRPGDTLRIGERWF
jgi:polysaccharide export outer membrane protein